ncbi:MAG: AraC family transcriptional regulator, partial [Eubacteriales bacterium]|nr:AraC family transcriptional regulator [Eubacteriales bacterium]
SYLTYLNALKIDRAVELMKEGKSTTFCCYECGFTNLSYFISLFRRYTGCSTVEYRRRQGLPREQDDGNPNL